MKALMLGVAALSMLAVPALAQTQAVAVNATVGAACGLDNQSGGGTGGYTPTATINSMIDGNGFLNTSASATIGFGNVWCNGASSLGLTATPFVTTTTNTDPSSFVSAVDMIVDGGTTPNRSVLLYFGDLGTKQARTGSPLSFTNPGAFETGNGDFQTARVRLALPATTSGQDRPLAGLYNGTVTLTVSPN